MPKGLKKHEDKEQGKTKLEALRSINHTVTTALERSAAKTTGSGVGSKDLDED